MKRLVMLWALTSAIAASGCAEIQEMSISARNRSAAYAAWKAARWDYWRQGVPYRVREHIGRGFQEGYYEVANGGSGKLPLFPPSYYWGVQFQSAAGNELVAAWFRGYQDGTMAAERDGIGGFNQLPSSYSGVGPMPGTAPAYDPNQPAGPYGEPLPPPSTTELTPVPPTLSPEPTVPPPLQEEVPLRTLDQPAFPAMPKPAAPMPVPMPPADGLPALNTPGTPPAPSTTPAPGTPPAPAAVPTPMVVPKASGIPQPSGVPQPSAVPTPTAPAAPKPTGTSTPTGTPLKIGADEFFESTPPAAASLPPATPYAQQTLFAEPN